ncbi:M48 family metallopeptidase [Sphingopyxis solisilvae]|uniref:M48 family metallopeptidase n=1 Tax=Sphingopyxis solisilvae TaxID=1886788 RepID=UPI001892B5C0|nr:M48 family metallopeptidase [Sphingopyxis solisilvae]
MLSLARTILAACTLSAAAPASAAAAAPQPSLYATLAAQEARVAAIGFRLTTENAGWCAKQQPQFGWVWGDPRLYAPERRGEALAAYGASVGDAPFVAAVAPSSPAAVAGLVVGQVITALDSKPVPYGADDHPFARITAIETGLAARSPTAPLSVASGAGEPLTVVPMTGCVSDFRVEAGNREGAVADGRMVLVHQGLIAFAPGDDELAAAIAHELAHNILRHRERLDAAGVDRGPGKQFGRSARLFKQTEIEADRLSVWLLAGAGYDPDAAARFWTRFGQRKGRPLFPPGTHPGWRERVATLQAEAAVIAAARASGETLRPPLVDALPPLE